MTACDEHLRRARLLAALAGHLEVEWRARRSTLRDVLALPDDLLAQSLAKRSAEEVLQRDVRDVPAACAAAGVVPVCPCDGNYPDRLRDLTDAPAVLFCAGDVGMLSDRLGEDGEDRRLPAAAVVGTRQASPEAQEMARRIGRGLAAAGVTVVSGMAMGIDAMAHRGAIDAGGPTVAVLACGPDVAYPAREAVLHRSILDNGLVISELPPGMTPWRWAFPARNRIIAALGGLTIVVEGAARSGSLITAEFAAQLGRDVGAVPGRAGSKFTRGSNGLLKEGAAVILDAEDALDAVLGTDRERRPAAERPPLAPTLQALLTSVEAGHVTLPALVSAGHGADDVLVGLSQLESLGRVRRASGGVVVPVS